MLALRGGVTCEVPNAMWMVPPQCAVWIPGGTPHSNHVTANARICFLFVEPGATALPAETCTLSISPLVRELIEHLADHDDQQYALDSQQVVVHAAAPCPIPTKQAMIDWCGSGSATKVPWMPRGST